MAAISKRGFWPPFLLKMINTESQIFLLPFSFALRSSGKSTNGGNAIEAFPQSRITVTLARPLFWITAFKKWVVPTCLKNNFWEIYYSSNTFFVVKWFCFQGFYCQHWIILFYFWVWMSKGIDFLINLANSLTFCEKSMAVQSAENKATSNIYIYTQEVWIVVDV